MSKKVWTPEEASEIMAESCNFFHQAMLDFAAKKGLSVGDDGGPILMGIAMFVAHFVKDGGEPQLQRFANVVRACAKELDVVETLDSSIQGEAKKEPP